MNKFIKESYGDSSVRIYNIGNDGYISRWVYFLNNNTIHCSRVINNDFFGIKFIKS